jgi:hypothetical protein
MYKTLKFKIDGIAPLIMHNQQLCDPCNPITRLMKAITAKGKKKTDADQEELARLEFMGGLYVGDDGAPIVPGEMIEAVIRDGARKSRQGKDSLSGIISDGNWPLIYDGPKTADELWEDARFRDARGVVIGKSRIIRMRPKFTVWALKFEVSYLEDVVNAKDVTSWLEEAGRIVGMGDFRPRFGRFLRSA